MARKHPPYTPEFRRQMIELVRSGRRPEQLAKEFEPTAQAIRNWVAQADRDGGSRDDGLKTEERDEGIVGVSRRKFAVTTVRDGGRQAPDLVDRTFTADARNVLWVADITYIPTWAGFVYLAVVLDVFSRRVVGWSMSTTLHTTVVLDA